MIIKRAGLAACAALLSAVFLAPKASAATISVADGTATLVAGSGEINDILATAGHPSADQFDINVTDAGALLIAGPGCGPRVGGAGVTCADVDNLVVWAGDRDDRVRLTDRVGFPNASLYGQAGADALSAESSVGFSPLLDGGNGADTLLANMNDGDSPVLRGGGGADSLTLTHVAGGGVFGGAGDDDIVTLTSGTSPLALDGEGGNDTYTFVDAGRGTRPEAIVPGPGFDTLDESGATPDEFRPFDFDMSLCPAGCVEQVIGTSGDDHIVGDSRTQIILGGDGNDTLDGGGGLDLVSGDTGDDTIEARDGAFDTIACDGGFDTVTADRFDLISPDCDDVTRGTPDV